jgi:hypothetical protein
MSRLTELRQADSLRIRIPTSHQRELRNASKFCFCSSVQKARIYLNRALQDDSAPT